mgnify:CR=1 FL=1|tara:strand:- start:538 stop:759 length:222 start_codon:yes stop_codon:yes gene_type:complete
MSNPRNVNDCSENANDNSDRSLDSQLETETHVGKTPNDETDCDQQSPDDMTAAYLQQQRRLACPGCGEEPFLG